MYAVKLIINFSNKLKTTRQKKWTAQGKLYFYCYECRSIEKNQRLTSNFRKRLRWMILGRIIETIKEIT